MDAVSRAAALRSQRTEITEYNIYSWLARRSTGENAKILGEIAKDELRHYEFWKEQTKKEAAPRLFVVWWYLLLAKGFGIVFALKLMERGELRAQKAYLKLNHIAGVAKMLSDDEHHDDQLIALLKDERLEYAGSIVLGLNDALVQLTGALAGFTLALQNSGVVALAGLITGVAAALSMSTSGYIAFKEEGGEKTGKSPVKAAVYIGVSYFLTVLLLIVPYLLFDNVYQALAVTLSLAILIISLYTFYITTAKGGRFWTRFLAMTAISLGVAALSFIIGWAAQVLFGIEI